MRRKGGGFFEAPEKKGRGLIITSDAAIQKETGKGRKGGGGGESLHLSWGGGKGDTSTAKKNKEGKSSIPISPGVQKLREGRKKKP